MSRELPILALGFRPFYLLGAAFAAAVIPVWVLAFTGVIDLPGLADPLAWHGHEMIFGFAAAILAGFLLTAVKNWSGLATANGVPLASLAGLWCLGRVGMLFEPTTLTALVDLLFLPSVAIALAVPLLRSGKRRNLPLVAIVLLLAALNLLFHCGHLGLLEVEPLTIFAAAIMLFALLMTVIGGRVIPMFMRNSLPSVAFGRHVLRDRPLRNQPWLDRIAIGATLLVALLSFAEIWAEGIALFLVPAATLAALAQAARLWGWAPLATWRVPMLWILHVGYAWIPIAFALLAVVKLGGDVPPSLPLHALTIGAMSSLMLGMMTRSARGHTARPISAGRLEVLAFVAIQFAALARIVLPLFVPSLTSLAVTLAGTLWSVAFLLFLIVYWPILTRPRLDGQPG